MSVRLLDQQFPTQVTQINEGLKQKMHFAMSLRRASLPRKDFGALRRRSSGKVIAGFRS